MGSNPGGGYLCGRIQRLPLDIYRDARRLGEVEELCDVAAVSTTRTKIEHVSSSVEHGELAWSLVLRVLTQW